MLKYTWLMKENQWYITNNKGLSYTIPNNNGMFYLSELLLHPTYQIPYTRLVTKGLYKKPNLEFQHSFKFELLKYGFHEGNWYTAIPKADKKTIHEVAKEILHVKDQIAQFKEYEDLGRVELLESELSQLVEYFRSVFTSRRKIRMFRGEIDQLHSCVKKSLQRTYKMIREHDKELVSFLTSRIHLCNEFIEINRFESVEFRICR
jgi:hypothetical protein